MVTVFTINRNVAIKGLMTQLTTLSADISTTLFVDLVRVGTH